MNKIIYAPPIRKRDLCRRRSGGLPNIIWLTMKLTLLLTVLFAFQIRANIIAQEISLNVHDATFRSIMIDIQKQTGYSFIAKERLLKTALPVSVNIESQTIEDALPLLFEGQPFTYEVNGKIIIIKPATQRAALKSISTVSEKIQEEIQGRVVNEKGEPLPGVSILIKGTTRGTVTSSNGDYTLPASSKSDILIFSYIGFETQEIPLAGRNQLNITLIGSESDLDEVVVVGYGTQKKVNLTGAVESVDTERLQDRPTGNLGQALQGVSPGLNVFSNNSGGQPDATMNFNIRGIGTPLVLVDGLPVDINLVNPEDIESISIIKDASSAAIYGANAPYGVILITSKKGKAGNGKPILTYTNTLSASAPTVLPTPSNSLDFARYMNNATINAGSSALFTDDVISRIEQYLQNPGSIPAVGPDPLDPSKWAKRENANGNTNWYDELLKPWSFRQKHDLALNGATEVFDYYVSMGLFDHNGLLRYGDEGYNRYNINTNLGAKVNEWLKFNFLAKFSNSKADYPNDGYGLDRAVMWHDFSRRFPTDPLKYPDGQWSEMSRVSVFENGGRETHLTNDFWTKFETEISPLPGWEIKGDFGWNYRGLNSALHRAKMEVAGPDGTIYSHFDTTPLNSVTKTYAKSKYWNANIYSSYERNIADHYFKVLVGHQREYNSFDNLSGYRDNLLTDYVPVIILATGTMRVMDEISEWATMGTFARFNYNYNEKYLLEFNGRYQGSSRFEQRSRFGFFPSVSLAYRLSEENYWQPIKSVVNEFKLRASYGSLGNHNVANFLYLPIMPIRPQVSWVSENSPVSGVVAPGITSTALTWETVESANIGFDAQFFSNKMSVTFDVFRRDIDDMIGTPDPLPITLGTSVPQENNAAQKNVGWELSIGYNGAINDEFRYNINAGLTDYKTTITKWNNPNGVLNQHYQGKTLGEIWGYSSNGLFQSAEEIQNAPSQTRFFGVWNPGDVRYEDLNGDNVINPGLNTIDDHGDLSIIGNSNPRYLYSLNMGANYKSFDLNMFWTGVGKQQAALSDFVFWGHASHVWGTAVFKEHQDYYTPENTDAFWPRPYISSETDKNRQVSSRYLQDIPYLRLRNLSLGYTFSSNISRALSIERLRIVVNAENFLTFSSVQKFLDPEGVGGSWGSGKVYPIQKTLSFGLNVQF